MKNAKVTHVYLMNRAKASFSLSRKLESDSNLKILVKDIKDHFANPKTQWALSYHAYKDISSLNEIEFNLLLNRLDMRLGVGKISGVLSFRPKKKVLK